MTVQSCFQPKRGGNKKVTASTSSAASTIGAGEKSLRIHNAGAVVGYFVTYNAANETRTCTAADTPVGPAGAASSTLVIEKPQDHDTVAYLADSTTTVMHFQTGEGGY
jgi:hypothetical protein